MSSLTSACLPGRRATKVVDSGCVCARVHTLAHRCLKGTFTDFIMTSTDSVLEWAGTQGIGPHSTENRAREKGSEVQALCTDPRHPHRHYGWK